MLPRSEMAGEAVHLMETPTLTTTDNRAKRVEPLFREIGGGVSFWPMAIDAGEGKQVDERNAKS